MGIADWTILIHEIIQKYSTLQIKFFIVQCTCDPPCILCTPLLVILVYQSAARVRPKHFPGN